MNVVDAAFHTVHNYPGGSESLAPRLITYDKETGQKKSMSAAVLRSKVDPNKNTHHLRLDEACNLMALTGDYQILHALSMELGHVAIKQPIVDTNNEFSLFKHALREGNLHGGLMKLLDDALEDGEISPSEVAEFEEFIYAKISNLLGFKRVFAACQTPSKSSSGRLVPAKGTR
jgi:hypothetical protein